MRVGIDPGKKNLGIVVTEKEDIILAIHTPCTYFFLENFFIFLQHNYQVTAVNVERFIVYNRYSMTLLEEINRYIGVIQYLALKYLHIDIQLFTYKQWLSKVSKMYKKKCKDSETLLKQISEDKYQLLKKVNKQDHLIDAYFLSLL